MSLMVLPSLRLQYQNSAIDEESVEAWSSANVKETVEIENIERHSKINFFLIYPLVCELLVFQAQKTASLMDNLNLLFHVESPPKYLSNTNSIGFFSLLLLNAS